MYAYVCVSLSIYSIYESVYLSMYQSINLSIYLSIDMCKNLGNIDMYKLYWKHMYIFIYICIAYLNVSTCFSAQI